MSSTFLDRAREAAQQAVAGAQDALTAAQSKLEDMSRSSQLDDLLGALGAAFYAEQRTGGSRTEVDAALSAIDRHIQAYGWDRDEHPSSTPDDPESPAGTDPAAPTGTS